MRDYERYTDDQLQSALQIVEAGLAQAYRDGNLAIIEDFIERQDEIRCEMNLRVLKAVKAITTHKWKLS